MNNSPLIIHSFPKAIIHIDGDAFFASCEQSRDPKLKGKPVITGKERGIAASLSYEAKAKGVTRGMRLSDILKLCPDAILLPSDYETYSLLSQRLYSIVRRYTSDVEEYSIDECFADLTGLRRPLRMSYEKIAEKIREELNKELGFTFSLGLAPNKVLAKVASKWKKPDGLTVISGRDINLFLEKLPVIKIWGIGNQTSAYLNKLGIQTALQFARKDEDWVKQHFTKPIYEIWQELNGRSILKLEIQEKESYHSIQKVKTFTPPSSDKNFVFSQLSKNIENACIKARRYKLAAKGVVIFLRTQDFRDTGLEIDFSRPTSFPNEIINTIKPAFESIFKTNCLYRSTGVVMYGLEEDLVKQMDLFGAHLNIEKMNRLFDGVDALKEKFGKHTIFLGSSFYANNTKQHDGERGHIVERKKLLFKGETYRRRLSIPMFLGNVD
jgi:DNA polymerase-4/DNA polymerase V